MSTNWASYVGIPFAPHGRTRDACDCWGLAQLAYREQFGVELPAYDAGYANAGRDDAADLARLIEAGRVAWREVPAGHERVGDLILLRLWNRPMHIGIVIGGKRMLHACEGVGTAVERYDGRAWQAKVVGFYRHPSLDIDDATRRPIESECRAAVGNRSHGGG